MQSDHESKSVRERERAREGGKDGEEASERERRGHPSYVRVVRWQVRASANTFCNLGICGQQAQTSLAATCSAICYSLVSRYSLCPLLSLLAMLHSLLSLSICTNGLSAPFACDESVISKVVKHHYVAETHQVARIDCRS